MSPFGGFTVGGVFNIFVEKSIWRASWAGCAPRCSVGGIYNNIVVNPIGFQIGVVFPKIGKYSPPVFTGISVKGVFAFYGVNSRRLGFAVFSAKGLGVSLSGGLSVSLWVSLPQGLGVPFPKGYRKGFDFKSGPPVGAPCCFGLKMGLIYQGFDKIPYRKY